MKDFVTQNIVLVVSVVVFLLALGAIALPVMQVNQAVADLEQVKSRLQQVQNAIRMAQSPKWIKDSEDAIRGIREDQESVIEEALLFCWRPPMLVDGKVVFPSADVQAERFRFRGYYLKQFDEWLKTLKATHAPTQEEFAKALEDAKTREMLVRPVGADGTPAALSSDELAELTDRVMRRLIYDAARAGHIYATEDAFHHLITDTGTIIDPTPEQMWAMQLNLWIQEDIVKAIVEANGKPVPRYSYPGGKETFVLGAPPVNVREAAVKRLLSIRVDKDYYRGPTGQAGSAAARPTMTGHLSGNKYDVLHYTFEVIMDTRRVSYLVTALSQQNFHTPLSISYSQLDTTQDPRNAIDPSRGAGMPIRDWGDDPVMKLTFECEAVFMKSPQSWRDPKDPVQSKRKRSEFFKKYPDKVLKLLRGKEEVALPADPAAREAKIRELIDSDPNITIIALYEDLIPEKVKSTLAGSGSAGGAAGNH